MGPVGTPARGKIAPTILMAKGVSDMQRFMKFSDSERLGEHVYFLLSNDHGLGNRFSVGGMLYAEATPR
ncbi:hypothetical protein [Bradyrhizobium sp. 76]|uniref:hypothetical protein n=1 Tax=Bradyrhizobium sp. 76 TaxID=2782680 RepID=UPI001FFBBA14|nr:hypothetical protein [Bradyrhizobium sp. 76]MCK1404935.1 hypothetical protein [Bradyrhizobium sp. 76]